MRIAHIADSHLGMRRYARSAPGGANQREVDVARAFTACLDGVIAARPDAVVFAGDFFESVRPPNNAIRFAMDELLRLRAALPTVPIVLAGGNHDTPRLAETGTILPLFAQAGVDVTLHEATRYRYPALDLAIFAVPHAALAAGGVELVPDGPERYQVLLVHGQVKGVSPGEGFVMTLLEPETLTAPKWSYVALGDYHVQQEIAPRVWYSGALDYVSPNIWGELQDEAKLGIPGKGWLLADLDSGEVTRCPVPASRPIYDLDPVHGEGMTAAELDAAILERVEAIPGGIEGAIVRLRVYGVPRLLTRELNHARLRGWKYAALHFAVEFMPVERRVVGVLAPRTPGGIRRPVREMVADYLARRDLPPGMDRPAFVRLGAELMDEDEYAGART